MRETVKTVKIPMIKRFTLSPKNKDEEKYLEGLLKLQEEKRRGDWKLVSEMVGISASSVQMAFFRVYQKNHFEVVEALRKVIQSRNKLIK